MALSVATEKIESGMVLAEPIFNRFGQILLNKGVSISDRHLHVLKTWGIPQVIVEGGVNTKHYEINEEMREWALAKLKKRLLWSPQTPVEEEMVHLAFLRAVQHTWQ